MSDIAEAVDRARLLLEAHQYDEALAILLEAEAVHPADEDLGIEIASLHLERGYHRLGSDDRAGAREDFDRVLARMESPTAQAGLAEIERRSGRFAEARVLYERALELDPEFVLARQGAASMRLAQGDAAGAEAEFREMALGAPSADSFLGLASALDALGRGDDARDVLEAAVHRFPEDDRVLVAAARRLEPKAELLARAIERNHRSFDAWFETAKLRFAQGDLAEAAEALERCLSLHAELTKARCDEELADPRSPMFAHADFVAERLA